MPPAELRLLPVQSQSDLREFITLPYSLYRQDKHWVPPLRFERRDLIDPKKNPFFKHGRARLFLAKRGAETVGRISAQINEAYARQHGEAVGHFGFFESENEPETAQVLWEGARDFFRKAGIAKVQGPFNYSINEESGLLVEGFEEPQVLMSPYNPPYYADLLAGLGFQKVMDLYAWRYREDLMTPEPAEIAAEILKDPKVKIVAFRKNRLEQDFEILVDIFNSAWRQNWGFIPFSPAESRRMAHELKIILDPDLAFRVEVAGKPAGVCLAVPNVYDILQGLNGRLFPLGWSKFLWRLKTRRIRSVRLMILGVKEEYRTYALGGLSTLLMSQCAKRAFQKGYFWGELSWTLENNDRINQAITFMGGQKYKTFRIYEKMI